MNNVVLRLFSDMFGTKKSTTMTKHKFLVAIFLLFVSSPALVWGASIAVDFGAGTWQSVMGLGETAGYVPQQNWNSFGGASGNQPLIDNSGLLTSATVSWTSNNLYQVQDGQADTPGNRRMMLGYLDTSNTSTTTITFSNLPAAYLSTGYDVFLYFDGSNGASNRTGQYSLLPTGGNTITKYGRDAGNTYYNGTFIEADSLTAPTTTTSAPAGNFLRFSSVTASSFSLTANGSLSEGFSRAPVNGVQIVQLQIPEPSTFALLTAGAIGLLAYGWRKRRAARRSPKRTTLPNLLH